MIQVEGLTRIFGTTTAIDGLDFSVKAGEIVGFLGLNGAGKTTTMRILAGSLGATRGEARIAGHCVQKEPRQAKACVGYLPERLPLHPEMTIRAYLDHAARIKSVPAPRQAVDRSIERTSLGQVAHRLIGNLSKGYRQRVGLAQALVHDPAVLILDEPGTGLDPAQRAEIRELIGELAQDSGTVLLSTHVLAEVEALCTRVLVLHQGQIVAQDDLEAMRSIHLHLARPTDAAMRDLSEVPGVGDVHPLGEGRFSVSAGSNRELLAQAAAPHGLLEMSLRHRLEERFLSLTQSEST